MKRRTFGHWLLRGGAATLGPVAGGCAAPTARPMARAVTAPADTPVVDHPDTLSRLPEPGPAVPLHVPARSEELRGDNGLTLIVSPRPGLPLASVALLVRCGPAFDPPGRRGCAELLAQLLTKGAVRRGRAVDGVALSRQAEALGGAVSVRVEERLIALEMTVLTPRIPAALALLADLLRHPLLSASDLQRTRSQMRDGLAFRRQDPAVLAALVAHRTAWGHGAQGELTTPDSVMSVRLEDVVALHRRWVRPDRVAVVLAGDIDPAAARAVVGPVLGDWPLSMEPPPADPAELPGEAMAPVLAPTLLIHLPSATQSSVLLCAPFVGTDAPDHAAGTLAVAVMGAGYSARLNQEVRIRRGLSYGVSGRVEQQRLSGLFIAAAQTEHGHAAEVAGLMQRQLQGLEQQPVTQAELVARRAALIGEFARKLDTTSGMVARIGDDWALGGAPGHLARWPQRLEAVTPAQVQAFAQRHWTPERLRTVIVGPIDRVLAGGRAPPPGAVRLEGASLVLGSPTLRR
jgi:zinc protease